MKQNLATTVSSAGFFSILMDGSTDASNTDNELFLVMWCDPNGSDEKVHSALSYLCIDCPVDGTAKGLLGSLQHALERLDIPMCNMLKVLHHNQLIPIECHLTFNGEEGVNTSTKI